jgi:hypothetical protein
LRSIARGRALSILTLHPTSVTVGGHAEPDQREVLMTTPVLTRVDLDAEPVQARDGARRESRRWESERHALSYDGTDAPAGVDGHTSPPGNGDLDQPELERGERTLARVLGW